MINNLKKIMPFATKQDVLAMCALQSINNNKKQIDNAIDGEETIERIKKINLILDQYLDK
jgi:cell division protein ZapA